MRRVHGLLARHNLSLQDVLASTPHLEGTDRVHETVVASHNPWERSVWYATASLYFCVYFFEKSTEHRGQRVRIVGVRHSLVGQPHNVLVSRLMTDYFLKTIRRLGRNEARSLPSSERNSFSHSFRVACAARLAERIRDRERSSKAGSDWQEGQTGASHLPALRPLYQLEEDANRELLANKGIELVASRRGGPRTTDIYGEYAGRQAADGIGLDPQLGAGRTSQRSSRLSDGTGQIDLPLAGV
jgi:hypothetical protein